MCASKVFKGAKKVVDTAGKAAGEGIAFVFRPDEAGYKSSGAGAKKKKEMPEPPPSPKEAEKEAKDAADKAVLEEDKKMKLRSGRNSTILTGALGLMDNPWLQRKTLLGQ